MLLQIAAIHQQFDGAGFHVVLVKRAGVEKQGNHAATEAEFLQGFSAPAEREDGQSRTQARHQQGGGARLGETGDAPHIAVVVGGVDG